jgi:sulfonate transport system permease protein
MNWPERLRGMGGIVLFLAAWEAVVRGGWVQYDYLPAPSAIFGGLLQLIDDGTVFAEVAHTVSATLVGWLCAVAIGGVVGIVLSLYPVVRTYSSTTIELLRPLPAVALVPIALLFFGFSLQTELFVIIIPCIWPVLVSTMAGLAAVPDRLRDVGRSMRLTQREIVTKVLIPAAAPTVIVGCRLSLGIALVLAIISEMIGNPDGLGNAVVQEAEALHPDLMFAYVLITGALGIALNALLIGVARVVLPGAFGRPQPR